MEKLCPFCGEKIPADAQTCMYCGEKQPESSSMQVSSVSTLLETVCSGQGPKVDSTRPVAAPVRKRKTGLIVGLSLTGVLILVGVCLFLVYKSNYRQRAEKFLLKEEGISEYNVLIQCEGNKPSVYYRDYLGFPMRYDLRWRIKAPLRSFLCANDGHEVHYTQPSTYAEMPNVIYYRNNLVISGFCDDGSNGVRRDVVVYDTYSGEARHICSSRSVKICLPFVVSNEYPNGFGYYDVETGKKVEMIKFSGDRGGRGLNMELAVADNGKVVGDLNYVEDGPYIRHHIEGYYKDGRMSLNVFQSLHEESDMLETMSLAYLENGNMTGVWNSRKVEWELPLNLNRK